MTVMLTPGIMSSSDNLDEDAYLVAIANNSGLILVQLLFMMLSKHQLLYGEMILVRLILMVLKLEMLFQLVNGNDLYDVEFTQWLQEMVRLMFQMLQIYLVM